MLRLYVKMFRSCSRLRLQNLFYCRKPFKRSISKRKCESLRQIIYCMCSVLTSPQQHVIQILESDSLIHFKVDQRLKTVKNGIIHNLKTQYFWANDRTNQFLLLQKQLKCPELYHPAFCVCQNEKTKVKNKNKKSRKIYYYCCCWIKKTIHITLVFLSC